MFNQAFALIIVFVSSVTDGDTFRTDEGERIRLWGIDAPEMYEAAGPAAKAELEGIIDNALLHCYVMGYDNYGRTVARCETGLFQDVGCMMIERGHAEEWEYYSRGEYNDC